MRPEVCNVEPSARTRRLHADLGGSACVALSLRAGTGAAGIVSALVCGCAHASTRRGSGVREGAALEI